VGNQQEEATVGCCNQPVVAVLQRSPRQIGFHALATGLMRFCYFVSEKP
jgi:hypothetical protein